MVEIHRMQIDDPDAVFMAPAEVTFGWQEARKAFSVWFRSDAVMDTKYRIVATGHKAHIGSVILRQSVTLPDGFMTFHLIQIVKD